MRMLLTCAVLSASILVLGVGTVTEAAEFDEASVKGPYSLSLNGTITFAIGEPLFLPTWSVGVMRADGAGHIVTFEAMANVGGCAILKQAGTGTYSVNPNGTGRVEVHLTLEPVGAPNAQCPTLDQELFLDNAQFGFNFAINVDGLDLVGISWEGPDGPISAGGASGQAKPQVKASSTRATSK